MLEALPKHLRSRFRGLRDRFRALRSRFRLDPPNPGVLPPRALYPPIVGPANLLRNVFEAPPKHFEVASGHFEVAHEHADVATEHFQVASEQVEVVSKESRLVTRRFPLLNKHKFAPIQMLIEKTAAASSIGKLSVL